MLIKDMFQKEIERNIRGVIKVAQTDEADIHQELDEYVVTQELHRHFAKLYDNYQKSIDGPTDKMGVWISGFFGSGKSHFLKTLSYLLENKRVKGHEAMEYFTDKVEDPQTLENMRRSTDVHTEVILFNIDSKSSLDSKSKEDAILRVFMKVFYEHQGYYGDIPGVAEMERYLDRRGVYESFQSAFKALSGEAWTERRNTFYFDADYVIGALTKVTDMSEESARYWFENGVNNFEISIGKFAQEVKEYIDQKGENFHLVFLVDEIGQYIGDSRNLMLNLQTLTEDLGTYCEGKVWIMVTSQESIDNIVQVKGDDFSRIQGRFDTRLSLSSISVDEVIQKRILLKKDFVKDRLKLLYPEKSAILKNLISFQGNTADLGGFESAQAFADVYPFIPYQFNLLQKVFEQVRKHGSSGKHLSEGERSMLSAFKEAGLQFKAAEEGALIPFYAFYDTINEFLNPAISRVIEGAAENPKLSDDPFHVQVLKVLFMIKYIKELPANLDNIATLMVTHMEENKLKLKEKIKISLSKLISQTLIQKNGDYYIFLTDDEQDINKEIKALPIDDNLVKRELASYIFQDLYDDRRFQYSSSYAFIYNQKMDEKNYGNQTARIGLQVLSPLSEHAYKSEQELMMMTSGNNEMLVKLGGNGGYIEEMEEAIRIEEYRKQKNMTELPEAIQHILNNKQAEVRERRRRVRELLEDAIKHAAYFMNGNKINSTGSTVREKINGAFHLLVENVYTKLGYIEEHVESDRELLAILTSREEQTSLSDSLDDHPNKLAKRDMAEFIQLQSHLNQQIRVKTLLDRFHDQPYGWRMLDTAALIAEWMKEQDIRIRYQAEYLEPEKDAHTLLTVLTKTAEADQAIVIKRVQVDETLIRTAKRICRDVFNKTDLPDDEDGLIHAIRTLMDEQTIKLKGLKERYENRLYPGMSLIDKGLEYFRMFDRGIDNITFFNKLKELEKQLLDWEDDMVYVVNFFDVDKTDQKKIFDQGCKGLERYEENKAYLTGDKIEKVITALRSIVEDPIPYKKIKDIPILLNQGDEYLRFILEEKKENALEKIMTDFKTVTFLIGQHGVMDDTREKAKHYYEQLKENTHSFTNIYKVDATISQSTTFKESMEKKVKSEIDTWLDKREEEQAKPVTCDLDQNNKPAIQKQQVNVSTLVAIRTLATEDDVDNYIDLLQSKLKEMIKENKEIEFID